MTNGNSNPPATTSAPPLMAAGAGTAVSTGTLIMDTYEIEKLINSGGMGEVYRGRNIHNGEPVAIKIVLPSLAHDPKIVALFQKESTVLSRLSHEAIVRYHTFTIDRSIGRPCMVMEFVSGTPLGERVEQGPMPLDEVKVMFRRVASGLDKAHRAGVVHRDLSPDNVILEEGSVDHAKLIDFGIAKSASFGGGTLLGGQFAGKFNWVAPEQLGAYGGLVDGRSDIYSLALLVAAASRGKVVAMGDSIVDAVGKRMGVPDLTGVDPELLPLLSYMLQPDPANRPDSMAAVIAALDNPALVPAVASTSAPQAKDLNRTVIGGALPIAPQTQTPVSVAPAAPAPMPTPLPAATLATSSPPTSDWAVQQGRPTTSNPATIIAPQIQISQAPIPLSNPVEAEDVSPFGAPSDPATLSAVSASSTSASPVKKGGSGMLAVVGLLVVVGGAAGAYFGGFIGAPVELTADQRIAQDEIKAKAAEEAAKTAEQNAAEAEAKLAAEKLAAVAADAEAAKQAEAAKAEAERIAQEAKAAEAAAAKEAAARKAEEDVAAKKAADEAAAAKLAEEAAAKVAADQAAAEAKAQAEAAAKAAEAKAAAVKAAEAEAAAAAAAKAAAKADPIVAQQEWLKATPMPTCVHLRPATDADALTLDGYATSTGPLEELSRSLSAQLKREADIAPRLINDAQCPVIGFANTRQSAEVPALTVRRDGPEAAVKSGGKISLVVEGINGRPYAIFLFSDAGGATNLKPFVAESSDGKATFTFTLSMAAGAPPAPQVVLVMATETALAKLDLVPNGVTAKSLMPFIEVALKDNKGPTALGLGFFRLEN